MKTRICDICEKPILRDYCKRIKIKNEFYNSSGIIDRYFQTSNKLDLCVDCYLELKKYLRSLAKMKEEKLNAKRT